VSGAREVWACALGATIKLCAHSGRTELAPRDVLESTCNGCGTGQSFADWIRLQAGPARMPLEIREPGNPYRVLKEWQALHGRSARCAGASLRRIQQVTPLSMIAFRRIRCASASNLRYSHRKQNTFNHTKCFTNRASVRSGCSRNEN
jgi:hypothetical protein